MFNIGNIDERKVIGRDSRRILNSFLRIVDCFFLWIFMVFDIDK